jgi:DNA-directed RNA polymerase specialized sigma24 family protein
VLAREPTPEEAAEMEEEFQRLLALLPEDELRLRDVAVAKMEGYSNAEIAEQLGWVERTVKRRLAMIRAIWTGQEVLHE